MALLRETQPLVERRGDSYLRAEWALERAVLSIPLRDLVGARRALDDFVGLSEATDVGRRGDVHWLAGALAHSSGEKLRAEIEFAPAPQGFGRG